MTILRRFKAHHHELGEFSKIEQPRHHRPDVCAMLLITERAPRTPGQGAPRPLICKASHGCLYFDVDPDALASVLTEADVIELLRCGVTLGSDGLLMMV